MTKGMKTENDLDERFQWHEGMDPNHIFDEELRMIKELRKKIPELAAETDKFVAVFLFARRHNMPDVEELLNKFYKKKAEYAYAFPGQHIPSFQYSNLAERAKVGGAANLQPHGYRDKKGRMLRYFLMGLDNPSARTLEYTYVAFYWQTYYTIETEPLSAWRNGVCIVVDLKSAGLRNLDISAKGRESHSALQGTFPFRVRSMLVVNGGFFINALMTGAKLALPKKLYDRIKLMSASDLKDHIPMDNLLPQFGGSAPPFTFDVYYQEIQKIEEELFSKGTWKIPDGASA